MKPFRVLLVLLCLAGWASATTFTVAPTGTCPTDIINIQAAVDAAISSDVVQLTAGEFNFTCASDFGGVFVNKAGLTLAGSPGTVLRGPGASDPNENAAIFVAAHSVTITQIVFRDFFFGVFVQRGKNNVTISKCTFDGVLISIQIAREGNSAKILFNVINVPAPPSADQASDFATALGIFIARQNNYVLAVGNTITGPGRVANFQRIEDLLAGSGPTALQLRTAGIWQVDALPPASSWGRISNNTVTGVDLGIQSSSNFAVVSNNAINNSAIGLGISNDTDDGVTQVTDGIITSNDVRGNQVGVWMASAARNVLSFNDARGNSLAGILFLNNVNGGPTDTNLFILNQGSKQGVTGNQGSFLRNFKD